MFGGVVLDPVLGPPKPIRASWLCTWCDVRWLGDGLCWSCGSSDFLFQYLPAGGWWAFTMVTSPDTHIS